MNICACSLNSVQCHRVNHIQERTRVLFVEDKGCILETLQTYKQSYMVLNTQIFLKTISGIPTCFSLNHNPNNTQLHQLRRICGSSEEETLLRLLQLLLVIGSTCLSSAAAYQLHKISDYVYLCKISNKVCGFQTERIVHRSLLFRLSENDCNQVQLPERFHPRHDKQDQTKRNSPPTLARTSALFWCSRPDLKSNETVLGNSLICLEI